MRKKLLFLMLVALGAANAQERPFFSEYQCNSIYSDPNGYIYIISNNAIEKFDKKGLKLNSYSNYTYGNITCVDTRIPSKILVFYKESGNITLLGNDLEEVSANISLFDKGWMNFSFAAMGGSDRFVLYDNVKQELTITDLNLTVLSKSAISFPEEFDVTNLQVVPNRSIALTDTAKGICLFDYYGTFEKYIPIQNLTLVKFYKNSFFYIRQGKLFRYSLPTESTPLEIEEIESVFIPNIKDFIITNTKLYYINSNCETKKIEVTDF